VDVEVEVDEVDEAGAVVDVVVEEVVVVVDFSRLVPATALSAVIEERAMRVRTAAQTPARYLVRLRDDVDRRGIWFHRPTPRKHLSLDGPELCVLWTGRVP
jgi:hypothetical protein